MVQSDLPILDYSGPARDPRLLDLFSDGKTWLAVRGPAAELPPRCVVCNSSHAVNPVVARLHYVDPQLRRSYRGGIMFYWLYLLVLIVRNIHERAVRQTVQLTYFVCPAHRHRRTLLLLCRWLVLVFSLLTIPAAYAFELGDGAVFLGCMVLVVSLILPWPKRPLRIARMQGEYALLTGPAVDFLRSLPRR